MLRSRCGRNDKGDRASDESLVTQRQTWLGGVRLQGELHDQALLGGFPRARLDRANGSGVDAYGDLLADFERVVVAEVAGRHDLITTTEFVPVLDCSHCSSTIRGSRPAKASATSLTEPSVALK